MSAPAAFNSPLNNEETTQRREPYVVADDAGRSLDHFYIPAHYQETLKEMLVPHGMIVDRVEKLAYDIAEDYKGLTIHFLVVLKGKGLRCCCALCLTAGWQQVDQPSSWTSSTPSEGSMTVSPSPLHAWLTLTLRRCPSVVHPLHLRLHPRQVVRGH